MAENQGRNGLSGSAGRSGNDFLQRSGAGHQSWGAEGPSGVTGSGSIADDGLHSAGASWEWGQGAGGGYGRSADYGHSGGEGRWGGADAGRPPNANASGQHSLVREHWLRSSGGSSVRPLLAGLGIGAAIMYFLDPDRGARRRNMVRDQVAAAARSAADSLQDRTAHVRNRAVGAAAEVRSRITEDEVADEQLVARVRAQLGHHVERVRPIQVAAESGTVTLSGTVREEELPTVLATVEKVRGVEHVESRLECSAE